MSILALIILIPIFCIGLVLYMVTLYNYAVLNILDAPLLIIGILIVIILSFFIIKVFFKNLPKTAKNLNNELNSNIIYTIFSLVIILLLGGSIFIKSLFNDFDIWNFLVGLILITFSLYFISDFFLSFEEVILKLTNIEIVDHEIKYLKLDHEKYGEFEYYTNKDNFKINNYYKAKINKKTKVISTIINTMNNENSRGNL